jgi:hypothetical protein
MTFSPQQALGFARALARPRRVGSSGDQAAAAEIVDLMTEFGYKVEQQSFQFYASLHGWIRLELVIGALLIITMMILHSLSSWVRFLPAILIIALISLVNPLHRWVQSASILLEARPRLTAGARLLSWIGPCYTSTNIVATSTELQKADFVPHLLLMAHYDSKSQTLPLPLRMGLFALFILGGFSSATLMILSLLLPSLATPIPYIAWSSLLPGILLITMKVGNDSPGATDNASGVGLVLHLAENLATNKDLFQKLRVDFLFTAAEEEGLMGAQAYVVMNKSMLQSQAQSGGVYILNFDGIGAKGRLLLNGTSQKGNFARGDSLGRRLSEISSLVLSWTTPPLPIKGLTLSPCRPLEPLHGVCIRVGILQNNYTLKALTNPRVLPFS